MTPLRIVLVEDNAIIIALVAEMLADLGHDVCAMARTELQAIEAAAHHAPDLMIVDAYLQAGTGVAAMNAILRDRAMPHIFMTGGSRQIIPPMAHVLYKPFGRAGLIAALDGIAGQISPVTEGFKHVQA